MGVQEFVLHISLDSSKAQLPAEKMRPRVTTKVSFSITLMSKQLNVSNSFSNYLFSGDSEKKKSIAPVLKSLTV